MTPHVRLAVILLAVVAAVAPIPPDLIERWYSRSVYPTWQRAATSMSNVAPFALFDVLIVVVGVCVVWRVWRRLRNSRGRRMRAAAHALADVLAVAAVVYVVFLVTWGFNYRRVLLRDTSSFDRGRVTAAALSRLADAAVQDTSAMVRDGTAHAAPNLDLLAREVHVTRDQLITYRLPFAAGVPKRSALGLYFRWAGIDGMTDPILLETLVNPDLLPVERPFTLAHEWAHLAGWAHEAEANFIAWEACRFADAPARYSAWLAIIPYLMRDLGQDGRRAFGAKLAPDVWRDLRAIAARAARASPVVQRSAERVYDTYLKANRVPSGVANYGEVVTLILGMPRNTRESF